MTVDLRVNNRPSHGGEGKSNNYEVRGPNSAAESEYKLPIDLQRAV